MYCSKQEDRVKEVNYIVKIGKDHGYKKQFIQSIYREVNQRISNKKRENKEVTNTRVDENRKNTWMMVPHDLGKYSCIKKLAKGQDKKLVSRRLQTIYNRLKNEKQPLTETERTGVYEILVTKMKEGECSKYIGVTTRTLGQRIAKHKKDIYKGKLSTALAIEAYDNDLEVHWNRAKIIR